MKGSRMQIDALVRLLGGERTEERDGTWRWTPPSDIQIDEIESYEDELVAKTLYEITANETLWVDQTYDKVSDAWDIEIRRKPWNT